MPWMRSSPRAGRSTGRERRGSSPQRALTVGSNSFWQWTDYDDRGLLWKVSASTTAVKPGTADVTYTYRPSGVPATRQFAGGPSVPFTYSIREQLARIGDPATTTYPFSARYAYHANGTVSEAEFYQAGTSATAKRYRYVVGAANYDALNRLKAADFSPWSGTSWTSTLAYDLSNITYDAAGNLTALRRYRSAATLVDQLTYTMPGGSNRLTSLTDAIAPTAEPWDAEGGSFTHDANGNVVTAPGPYSITATTYDAWNRRLSLTRAGTTSTYRYAAGGQRLAKQVGAGAAEVYITDGPTTLAVFTVPASGTPSAWHFNLLADDHVIGRQPSAGSRLYYHRDLLNSTRAVVTGTTVVESRDYDPWGVELAGRTLGSGTKEGFTGQERDAESGVDAFWARGYLSALGRWGSVDPLRDSFPAWSPYNYVEGNPVGVDDPFGLCPSCGDEAADFYAGVIVGSRSATARGAARVGLAFSSLWTSDTWVRTTLTLASGGTASAGLRIARGAGAATATAAATAPVALGAGVPAVQKLTVQFGRVANQVHHAFRHTDRLGLDRSAVRSAIEQHLPTVVHQLSPGRPLNQVIEVSGKQVQYTAYQLSQGVVNVGRIQAVP